MAQPATLPLSGSRAHRIIDTFQTCRQELDEHHERRERIIRISRDVTAQSKKIIFALHRIANRDPTAVLKEARQKDSEVLALFDALSTEMGGKGDYWKYKKSISPGIQEYVESLSFLHYLSTQTIISPQSVQSHLSTSPSCPDTTPSPKSTKTHLVTVTDEDYMLGIADLTGELMRYGINNAGITGKVRECAEVVRSIKDEMDPLTSNARYLRPKLEVMGNCLRKLEDANYAIAIRGSEYKDDPTMLAEMVRRMTSETMVNVDAVGGGAAGAGSGENGRGED